MDTQEIFNNIYKYFSEAGYNNCIIYGSFVEEYYDLGVSSPNDIDVVLITDEEPPEKRHKTFYLNFTELPINVEIMKRESFRAELNSMQPKYFMCACSNVDIANEIRDEYENAELSKIRSCISSISSKAFDKGKKKLLVEDDYDEVLGLKNIYHAFKFPLYVMMNYSKEGGNNYNTKLRRFHDIHEIIYSTYKNSSGTLQERVDTLMQVVKPMHNEVMTEFRKQFPKDNT